MPLSILYTPGYTFSDVVAFRAADLNAALAGSFTISGTIGSSDLAAGGVNSTHITPGPICYALTTGSADAYVAAPTPALAALTAGAWVCLKLSFTNTGPATLQVSGLVATALKKHGDQPLEAGDLRSGWLQWFQFDGTYWQLTSPPGSPRKTYAVATGAVNAYAIAFTDYAFSALSDLTGRLILFKTNLANTLACTLNPNGVGAAAIKTVAGADPAAGDLPADKIIGVVFDGTVFQMVANYGIASLPNVGPGAGAIAYPVSLTLDINGRVTAATPGTAPVASLKAFAVLAGTTAVSTKATVSAVAATDILTITAHGWSTGQLLWFATTSSGWTLNVPYYAEVLSADTLKLHTTLAGALAASTGDLVDLTTTGAVVVTANYWASNPLLASSGIDGIIRTAAGNCYVDFTVARASAYYFVGLSLGINPTASGDYLVYQGVDTTTLPTTGGFSFFAYDNTDLPPRVYVSITE